MTNEEMLFIVKNAVVNYFNENSDWKISIDNVFIVWFCKTIQNFKALVSTEVPDGMYYEVTFNGDTGELYLDAYKKWQKKVYTINNEAQQQERSPQEEVDSDTKEVEEEPKDQEVTVDEEIISSEEEVNSEEPFRD